MIAQVNPAIEYKEETKNTLTYATKAMGISKQVRLYSSLITTANRIPMILNLKSSAPTEIIFVAIDFLLFAPAVPVISIQK